MKIRFLVVAAAITGLAFLGGCGGGEPSEDASVGAAEAETVALGGAAAGAGLPAEDAGEDGLFGGRVIAEVTSGGSDQPKGDQPKIELETEIFEMGVVANDKVTHAEMKVYNRGTAPLRITQVKTSCGCTTGKMRDEVIAPGETGILEIQVDPAKIPAYFAQKTLTLSSNDPANPKIKVQVATHVEPEAEFTPMTFELGEVARGEGAEAVIHARQLQDETMLLENVTVRRVSPYITAELEPVPEEKWRVAGKAEYTIRAKLSPEAPPGRYNNYIQVTTNIKRQPKIGLSFRAVIPSVYTIAPARVMLRNAVYGQDYKGVLSVSSEKEFEILDFSNSNESVEVSHRLSDRSNAYVFDIVIDESNGSRLQRDKWTLKLRVDGEEFTENINVSLGMARDQ